jgi:ABC-type glycerol-3-phosphate transport system substrate-binding protein
MLSWGDYMQKMLSAVAAGTPPDVTGGDSGLPFNFYAQGEALELDALYEEWKSDGTFDDLTPWGQEKWFFNGHYVGVSWQIDARAIYYRTDLFEAAGVELPTTHDELLQVATQLTDRENEQYGICFPGKAGSYDTDQFYMTLVFQNGGMLSDAEGNPTFQTPEHEAALDLELKLLEAAAPEGTPGYTFAEISRLYMDGKCAMVFNGGWFIQQVKAEGPAVYPNTAILPPLTGTGPNATQQIVGFYNPWMIFKDTQHPAEAQEFLKFMASSENLMAIYQGDLGSKFSPYKSIRNEAFWESEPMAVELAQQVNDYSVDYWFPNNTAAIGIGSMGTSIADVIVNPVLTGALTPQEALAEGQEQIGKFFVQMGE